MAEYPSDAVWSIGDTREFQNGDRVGIKGTDVTGRVNYVDSVTVDIRTTDALYTVPPALVEPKPELVAEPGAECIVEADGVFYRKVKDSWTSNRVSSPWGTLCDRSRRVVVYRPHKVILDR